MRLLLVLAAALLISSCSSDVDEEAWRAEHEAMGATFKDWDAYKQLAQEVCDKDRHAFNIYVAVALDEGGLEGLEGLRINLRYLCEERLTELEEQLAFHRDPCAGLDADAQARMVEAGVDC